MEGGKEAMAESGKHGDHRFRVNAGKNGKEQPSPPNPTIKHLAAAHESGNPPGHFLQGSFPAVAMPAASPFEKVVRSYLN
jgi:hypothetical protein